MLNAHIDSMLALGEPFRATSPRPFPFKNQTITSRVRDQIPVMLRERLTPPPSETYSLNRKLSGAFLLCAKLEATVDCRKMWTDITEGYRLSPPPSTSAAAASTVSSVRGLHTSARRMDSRELL